MKEEIKQKALDAFLKNKYWESIYNKAPDKVKIFYELSFARAENLIGDNEDKEGTIALYKAFDDSDWEYLISHTQNRMGKWGYKKARERYGKKE